MWKRLIIILTIWLLSAAPLAAQECHYVYLPVIWSGVTGSGGGPEMSDWKIIIPESTTNQVLNPSAETTSNFAALGGATVTRSTTYQHYGVYSYRVQTASNNDGISLTTASLANLTHYVTVRVRGSLPAAWDWSLDDSNYTEPTLVEQIDSNWAVYGAQFPSGEAIGSTTLYIRQNGSGSGDFYLDGIQVEAKEYWTTYCDGTQEGCEWNGAENAATSQRSADSRAGGRVQDLQTDYALNITGMIDASVSPRNVSIDSYATLPGGELNNIKVSSRVFTLTGVINGTNQADLHSKKQNLLGALLGNDYPGEQPARLQYHGATTHKQIDAHYDAGLEGDQAGTDPCAWERVAVRMLAPQPYWEEIGESAAVLDTNDSATFTIVAARLRSTDQWDTLGPPDATGTYTRIGFRGIAEDDTYIYFGGDFVNFNNIANADYIVRWHKQDQTWSALSTGLNGTVEALEVGPDGLLYIGGFFTNAGGVANADYLAVWDGASFSAVGVPNTGAAVITTVYDLKFDQAGLLYVSGNFLNWNNIANADYIVSWDGSAYSALSTGANNIVYALAIGLDNTLYLGGGFTTPTTRIASWDGSSFSALGTGANSTVHTLAVGPNGLLYLGGTFTTLSGASINRIAYWNGTAFVAMSTNGANGAVYSVTVDPNGLVYVSGGFSTIGDLTVFADRIALWNGSVFAPLDVNLPGSPFIYEALISRPDPVIKQKYDLYLGFDTSGTGNYAGLVTVNNDSTVRTFPKIAFTRSGGTSATIVSLRNERTGRELSLAYSLLDGETLTIDLTPTDKSITSSFFTKKRFDAVLSNSDLGQWALLPNSNNVSSFVDVAGAPTITAYMLWKDQFESYD